MGRKFKVKRLPQNQRNTVNKLIQDDAKSIEEVREEFLQKHPDACISESALYNWRKAFGKSVERRQLLREHSKILAAQLGNEEDTDAQQTLVHLLENVMYDVLIQQQDQAADVKTLGHTARTLRNVIESGLLATKTRERIEEMARKRLVEELKTKAKSAKESGELSEQAEAKFYQLLGIA